jgi:hypothetical protein
MKMKWKANKNTEREAIRQHGKVWNGLRKEPFRGSMCWLIQSPDGSTERWINLEQVLGFQL